MYAVINSINWLTNDKRFHKSYTPTNPIEVV